VTALTDGGGSGVCLGHGCDGGGGGGRERGCDGGGGSGGSDSGADSVVGGDVVLVLLVDFIRDVDWEVSLIEDR